MRLALVFVTAVLLGAASPASADTPPKPQAQPVARGVWLIPGGMLANRQPDGNSVIFAAPEGLIVMDTGRHLWQREAILAFAKAQRRPIAAIVNSHWHLDHVSGNPVLKNVYPQAKVYASGAIKQALTGFLARSAKDAEDYMASNAVPPETADDIRHDIATTKAGELLLPDVKITKSSVRAIAGKTLHVNLARDAATAGDVWVYDPATKVVATGDLVTLPAPFLDTACAKGWSRALGQIEAVPFRIAIPGHGAPMTRSDFGVYRKAFDNLLTCSASARDAKDCADDWATGVQSLLGGDAYSLKQAKGMTAYYVNDVLRTHGGNSAECRA